MSSTPTDHSVSADISRSVVHLLSQYTGRGPTKARTYISEDLILVALRDSLTKGDRSLVASGNIDVVLDARSAYQAAMKEDLIAIVEKRTGRTVVAFMSENHIDPDIAVESFVLAPQAGDDPHAEHPLPELLAARLELLEATSAQPASNGFPAP